jgi:hypothetical protein
MEIERAWDDRAYVERRKSGLSVVGKGDFPRGGDKSVLIRILERCVWGTVGPSSSEPTDAGAA